MIHSLVTSKGRILGTRDKQWRHGVGTGMIFATIHSFTPKKSFKSVVLFSLPQRNVGRQLLTAN